MEKADLRSSEASFMQIGQLRCVHKALDLLLEIRSRTLKNEPVHKFIF